MTLEELKGLGATYEKCVQHKLLDDLTPVVLQSSLYGQAAYNAQKMNRGWREDAVEEEYSEVYVYHKGSWHYFHF